MWSLRDTLVSIGKHLPDGYSAQNGIRALFPVGQTASISTLSQYVLTWQGSISFWPSGALNYNAAPGSSLIFFGADGAGRWFLGWEPPDPEGPPYDGGFDQRARVAYVFNYSNDGIARGFAGPEQDVPNTPPPSCYCGVDDWIKEHWPEAFAAGLSFDVQAAESFDTLPPESDIWTSAGFQHFQALNSSPCTCVVTGSTEFPFSDFYNPPPPSSSTNGAATNVAAELLGDLLAWWLGL
jgi:hypothetical protein